MDSQHEFELSEAVVSACRTGLGDELRSVIYFTPGVFNLLYLRQDLYDDETTARAAKAALVEYERRVAWPDDRYVGGTDDSEAADGVGLPTVPAGFGEYEFTVRVFAGGFVGRVATADHGLIVTVDELDARALEDVAVTLRALLNEAPTVGDGGEDGATPDRNR